MLGRLLVILGLAVPSCSAQETAQITGRISPGATNFDFSIFKRYSLRMLGETGQVQVRFEGFNILDHPQFGQPNTNISTAGAGTITFLTTSMRQLQAGLKVMFRCGEAA